MGEMNEKRKRMTGGKDGKDGKDGKGDEKMGKRMYMHNECLFL